MGGVLKRHEWGFTFYRHFSCISQMLPDGVNKIDSAWRKNNTKSFALYSLVWCDIHLFLIKLTLSSRIII